MNRGYRIVWNVTVGQWVVASEMAKGCKKSSSNKVIVSGLLLAVASAGFSAFAPQAFAQTTGTVADSSGSTIISSDVNGSCAPASATGSTANSSTLAIGCGATSTKGGVAIGGGANANTGALALGASANASGLQSLAFGSHATASYDVAIALGSFSLASGYGAIAAGNRAQATGHFSLALGEHSRANGENGVAIGSTASVGSDITNSVALGAGSIADATTFDTASYNPGSSALSGVASADNGVVSVGSAGLERRITNVAPGGAPTDAVNVSQLQSEDAKVNTLGDNTATALGGGATYNTTSGAITAPAYTLSNANSIAGTNGAATDVGTGFAKVDAALGVINTNASKGWNLSANGAASQNVAPGDTVNFANGSNTSVTRTGETITYNVVDNPTFSGMVTANGGLTVGAGQTVNMGGNTVSNVAQGDLSATSTDAVNGSQLYATNQQVNTNTTSIAGNTTAINTIQGDINNIYGMGTAYFHANSTGADSQALGQDSVAIGMGAIANNANDVALGAGSVSAAANATSGAVIGGVSYSFAGTSPIGVVSVGSAGAQRQITNVAAGQLSATSTDAVNGSQLNATNQAVNQLSNTVQNFSNTVNNLGTGAVKYDTKADGTVNDNSVTLGGNGGTVIHNVADGTADTDAVNVGQLNQVISAVTNIAGNASDPMFSANGDRDTEAATASGTHATAAGANAVASGNQSTALGANSTASGNNSVALGAGSIAERDNTVSVGSAGNERQITNVAAGTQATDAVNVGQLNAATSQANQYTDQQVSAVGNALGSQIDQVARSAYSGVAAASALSMIPDVDLGKTVAVGVGTANFKGYQAVALGATVRVSQNLKMRVGAGTSASGTSVGAGASYQW
jgi:trimeric autotransporter adhesin